VLIRDLGDPRVLGTLETCASRFRHLVEAIAEARLP